MANDVMGGTRPELIPGTRGALRAPPDGYRVMVGRPVPLIHGTRVPSDIIEEHIRGTRRYPIGYRGYNSRYPSGTG